MKLKISTIGEIYRERFLLEIVKIQPIQPIFHFASIFLSYLWLHNFSCMAE